MDSFFELGGLLYNLSLVFIGILGINFLIAFHEFGHFLFCKLFKIKTPSFSIGFGPYLVSKKIGDTVFAISAIPFGGYVEIAGVQEVGQGEQKHAKNSDKHSFIYKPYYQKLLVLLGGIIFNLIFAYGVFTALFYFGVQKTMFLFPYQAQPIIASVAPDSPADKAHLEVHDTIKALNHNPINNNVMTFLELLRPFADKPCPITLTIERNGQTQDVELDLESAPEVKRQGILGIEFELQETKGRSFFEAFKQSLSATHTFFAATLAAFKNMFTKKTMKGLGGPIGIIKETVKGAAQGSKIFFLLLAIISINLAVLNIFPLPILDGGQVLFYTIEALIRRPLPEKAKMAIHYACWLALILLAIYLSFKDIAAIVREYFLK